MVKITNTIFIVFCLLLALNGHVFAGNDVFRNAEALMLKDDYSRAAKECEKILTSRQAAKIKAKAYYLLGVCLLKEGRVEEAKESFNELLRRYPGSKFCDEAKLLLRRSSFSVQVGCFTKEDNASRLRDELMNLGFQAYTLKLRGENLYRVRVGKFTSRQDVQFLEEQLKRRGYPTQICQ